MGNGLMLKNEYRIDFPGLIFKKQFLLMSIVGEYRKFEKEDISQEGISRFQVYNLDISDMKGERYVIFRNHSCIEEFNINIYDLLDKAGRMFSVMEIMDVCVSRKYQNRGIGSQLMRILDEISSENNIEFIVGELERDNLLEERKKFFQKNGYSMWKDEGAKFSGWVIKKQIKN